MTSGEGDHPSARLGLGRPEDQPATRDLGELTSHPDGARRQVDVTPAKRGRLSPAQAGEHRQEDQGAVPLLNRRQRGRRPAGSSGSAARWTLPGQLP
jgi:hypothetical protein